MVEKTKICGIILKYWRDILKKIEISLLEHTPFLKENGTFDREKALLHSARIGGICYSEEGYETLREEPLETTEKRKRGTLKLEHHSIFDHVNIGMAIKGIPKILAMFLNNENQYNTSEKSGRYTKIIGLDDSFVTPQTADLYNKWQTIFELEIKKEYSDVYNNQKIEKLAHENARYLVSVFVPTEMIYTVPLAQLNRIATFIDSYVEKNITSNEPFEKKLIPYMLEFKEKLAELNLLEPGLQTNRKNRDFSLLANDKKREHFGATYVTNYRGSLAQLAQAQRHRTLSYEMYPLRNHGQDTVELTSEQVFYVPPIIADDEALKKEWLTDMWQQLNIFPQGEKVQIVEAGTLENFALKVKERMCVEVQLEIFNQIRETLIKYREALSMNDQFLLRKIDESGPRCTFDDYDCARPCKLSKERIVKRKV